MNELKYAFLTCIATSILLLIFFEAKAVDITTQFIRGTWTVCYQSSVRKAPHIPPQVHAVFCDCMLDKGRVHFRSEENIRNYPDNATEVWTNIANDCNYELSQNNKPDHV